MQIDRIPFLFPEGNAAGLGSGRLPSFDPSVNFGLEEADLAPSVPREAYPLWKHAVLLPAPDRLTGDVKQPADFLHTVKPFHRTSSSNERASRDAAGPISSAARWY